MCRACVLHKWNFRIFVIQAQPGRDRPVLDRSYRWCPGDAYVRAKRRLANKSSNGNGSLRARMLVELEEPGLLANPGWFMPL